MKRAICILSAAMSAMTALVACDEKPKLPPTSQESAQVTPKPPTTQELLTGARTKLMLTAMPLSVTVPPSWKIDTVSGTTILLLKGPTPSGEAAIQLSHRPPTPKDRFAMLIEGATKEAKEKNDPREKAELRSLGDAKVLERQSVRAPAPLTTMDKDGKEHTQSVSGMAWTIHVFVPDQSNYDTYELNFFGLTLDQYEADKALLNAIVQSLAYEPAKV